MEVVLQESNIDKIFEEDNPHSNKIKDNNANATVTQINIQSCNDKISITEKHNSNAKKNPSVDAPSVNLDTPKATGSSSSSQDAAMLGT